MAAQTLFSRENIALIYQYSAGIPRLVNSLCDGALRTGFGVQSRFITDSMIREAAKDLDLDTKLTEDATPPQPAKTERVEKNGLRIPVRVASAGVVVNGANGAPVNGANGTQTPLESYASRQKSLGFFAGVMDRWK
jgi:hypothetical protein